MIGIIGVLLLRLVFGVSDIAKYMLGRLVTSSNTFNKELSLSFVYPGIKYVCFNGIWVGGRYEGV